MERLQILDVLCSDAFCDQPPAQVFHALLDQGVYLCSIRTMIRILADHGLTGDRRRGGHGHAGRFDIPVVHASKPNQAWSWDITKLKGPSKGVHDYLYTIMDIYSRYVVGWTISTRESAAIAHDLIRTAALREGIPAEQLTLHADRGSPMIAGNVADLLFDLGVKKSHSRPRVSNDNPYSESQLKTMKYRPDYPERFEDLHAARAWCRTFFAWYNTEHYHSGIAYLTPEMLHRQEHHEILDQRAATLQAAFEANPARFRKPPTPKQPPREAWINQPQLQTS